MAHIGIERLGAGHRQEDRTEDNEADKAVGEQELDAVLRHERHQNARLVEDMIKAKPAQDEEPQYHDRAEETGHLGRAF